MRHKAKRRRLRTVIQELMYLAARVVESVAIDLAAFQSNRGSHLTARFIDQISKWVFEQMGIASGGVRIGMPEQPTQLMKRSASRCDKSSKRVSQIMQSHIWQPRTPPDHLPLFLDANQMFSLPLPDDHKWVSVDLFQRIDDFDGKRIESNDLLPCL